MALHICGRRIQTVVSYAPSHRIPKQVSHNLKSTPGRDQLRDGLAVYVEDKQHITPARVLYP